MSAKNVLEPIAWLLQMFSGILLVVFVTAHFFMTHTSHEALSYASVAARFAAYRAFYAAFLLFVVFHAFNGVRAILLDTNFGAKNRGAVNVLCLIAMLAALAVGAYELSLI